MNRNSEWAMRGNDRCPGEDGATLDRRLGALFTGCGERGVFLANYFFTSRMHETASRLGLPVPDRAGFLATIVFPLPGDLAYGHFEGNLPGGILVPEELLAQKAVERLWWLLGGKTGETDDSPVVPGFVAGPLLRPASEEGR